MEKSLKPNVGVILTASDDGYVWVSNNIVVPLRAKIMSSEVGFFEKSYARYRGQLSGLYLALTLLFPMVISSRIVRLIGHGFYADFVLLVFWLAFADLVCRAVVLLVACGKMSVGWVNPFQTSVEFVGYDVVGLMLFPFLLLSEIFLINIFFSYRHDPLGYGLLSVVFVVLSQALMMSAIDVIAVYKARFGS